MKFERLGTQLIVGAAILAAPAIMLADEPASLTPDDVQANLNIVWTCIAAFLVFFMQAGFAMVETGFTRAKNAVNIMMKNMMDFAVGSLLFFLVGFGLMFGTSVSGIFGSDNFALGAFSNATLENYTFLIFQTVFAATAATIVSGAMSERTKFSSYLIYSVFITALIYPLLGKWAWGSLFLGEAGKGWLEKLGFIDFAGSTVVHSVGGWLALAGAYLLGPRIGKFGKDKKPRAILGHNLSLAALGVFILWFGWFGFNPGSTTTGTPAIGMIAVTTNLSGAAGAVSSMITAWILFKKPDASMTMNGILAGLVGITAGCANVTPLGAICIGLLAGIVVVFSILFIERILKIDDPVGAVSVHGVGGMFGTLMVGFFHSTDGLLYGGGFSLLGVQALGALVAFGWAFGLGVVLFTLIKKVNGLRVTEEEELKGLDIAEHGNEAYSGFQIFRTH